MDINQVRQLPEIEAIEQYLREMQFKKKLIGGCTEESVLDCFAEVTKKYEAILVMLFAQQERKDCEIASLHRELTKQAQETPQDYADVLASWKAQCERQAQVIAELQLELSNQPQKLPQEYLAATAALKERCEHQEQQLTMLRHQFAMLGESEAVVKKQQEAIQQQEQTIRHLHAELDQQSGQLATLRIELDKKQQTIDHVVLQHREIVGIIDQLRSAVHQIVTTDTATPACDVPHIAPPAPPTLVSDGGTTFPSITFNEGDVSQWLEELNSATDKPANDNLLCGGQVDHPKTIDQLMAEADMFLKDIVPNRTGFGDIKR